MFSFNWFMKNKPTEEVVKENVEVSKKPYSKLKLVNDVITVVFDNGDVLVKASENVDTYAKIRQCISEEEIMSLLSDEVSLKRMEDEKVDAKEKASVANGIHLLKSLNEEFEFIGDNMVVMKSTGRTIPSLLVERFAIIAHRHNGDVESIMNDEEYIGLKRFFLWCCLNPRAEVADRLYDFLTKNGMKITKQGFFVALRNVVKVENADTALTEFVSNAYNKVKAVWKKNPVNFRVMEIDGQYSIEKVTNTHPKGEVVGNLDTLYTTLPDQEGNRYTDNYTKTFDIRIGKAVSMPPEECSWSTADCSHKGLHFAGHTAPYVLCGDTTVFTLHNPMKVVGIGEQKGRCYEYLPFMITNIQEADEIMSSRSFDFLQLDETYAIDQLSQLEEKAKEGFSKEMRKYSFNIPSMSYNQMVNIVSSLEEMKNEINKRVQNLV